MSTLFGQMTPNEITAIKTKMPIAKSFEHHRDELKNLINDSTSYQIKSNNLNNKSTCDLTVEDIRYFFRS